MVYVQDIDGKPMMPTTRHGKVRRLLKDNKAVVVNTCPFTIKLTYKTSDYKQEIVLGVDSGTKHVGLSATTKSKELYASEVILRSDVVDLLSTRRGLRRTRRSRLRYRKQRFNNRVKSKKDGWIAPSVRHKIDSHIRIISFVYSILPVSKLIVEVAHILNIHHIESRKIGGDSPSNLITLCETCHKEFHKGNIKLKVSRGKSLRDAAVMGIMKWKLYEELKSRYDNVSMTFGYITKYNRINHGIEKSHVSDAFVISRNFNSCRLGYYYKRKLVRRHNRQIHKMKILKGGIRKRNQAPFKVFGFRLFDKVMFQGEEHFIYARRLSGQFNIRDINGENKKDVSCKKLKYVSHGLVSVKTNLFLSQ